MNKTADYFIRKMDMYWSKNWNRIEDDCGINIYKILNNRIIYSDFGRNFIQNQITTELNKNKMYNHVFELCGVRTIQIREFEIENKHVLVFKLYTALFNTINNVPDYFISIKYCDCSEDYVEGDTSYNPSNDNYVYEVGEILVDADTGFVYRVTSKNDIISDILNRYIGYLFIVPNTFASSKIDPSQICTIEDAYDIRNELIDETPINILALCKMIKMNLIPWFISEYPIININTDTDGSDGVISYDLDI